MTQGSVAAPASCGWMAACREAVARQTLLLRLFDLAESQILLPGRFGGHCSVCGMFTTNVTPGLALKPVQDRLEPSRPGSSRTWPQLDEWLQLQKGQGGSHHSKTGIAALTQRACDHHFGEKN